MKMPLKSDIFTWPVIFIDTVDKRKNIPKLDRESRGWGNMKHDFQV
jgi:hypothetical protein